MGELTAYIYPKKFALWKDSFWRSKETTCVLTGDSVPAKYDYLVVSVNCQEPWERKRPDTIFSIRIWPVYLHRRAKCVRANDTVLNSQSRNMKCRVWRWGYIYIYIYIYICEHVETLCSKHTSQMYLQTAPSSCLSTISKRIVNNKRAIDMIMMHRSLNQSLSIIHITYIYIYIYIGQSRTRCLSGSTAYARGHWKISQRRRDLYPALFSRISRAKMRRTDERTHEHASENGQRRAAAPNGVAKGSWTVETWIVWTILCLVFGIPYKKQMKKTSETHPPARHEVAAFSGGHDT